MSATPGNAELGVADPIAVPFLKWAGGKRWFVDRHMHLVPKQFKRYIEPFVGSGALFFSLRPKSALICDINADLINCYCMIRDNPNAVYKLLTEHHNLHCAAHYYAIRASKPLECIERAARFIYLNRTCWNGLYRVNKRNEFNVPIGTKTAVILPSDNFVALSDILNAADIETVDFECAIDCAEQDDFVFVDPPYTVKHNMNGFVKYNDRIFSWADQVRLRNAVVRAARRGAQVLVTNANHSSIRELYAGIGHHYVVERASVLAASPLHRNFTEELVISTCPYDVSDTGAGNFQPPSKRQVAGSSPAAVAS